MRCTYTPDQAALKARFAAIGARAVVRRRENFLGTRFDTETWHELAAAGLWRMPVPAHLGGLGGSWWDFAAAIEGLATGSGDIGFDLAAIAHAGIVRVVVERGSPEQQARFLPQLLSGTIAAMGITEPGGGSDVPRITTRSSGGPGEERLDGVKAHVTNAPMAEIFLVAGRIGSRQAKRDIGLFLVERGMPGLRTGPAEDTLGHRSSPTGEIRMEGVPITALNVMDDGGDGLQALYDVVAFDRALYALAAAGTGEPWLAQAFAHTATRRAFGSPLTSHQYVQQKLVEMKVAVESGRQAAYAALDLFLAGDPQARLHCSMAKLVATEGLWLASQNLMLLHGHAGYEQGEIARALCDAAGTRIAAGTNDIQRIAVFKALEAQYAAAAAPAPAPEPVEETSPCHACRAPSCQPASGEASPTRSCPAG